MNPHELFVAGCKADRWKWRAWRISIFTVSMLPEDHELEIYDVDYRKDGTYWYTSEGSWEQLKNVEPMEPILDNRALAKFEAGDISNHAGALETTYGRVLFNYMVIHYSFGDKLPFQHKVTGDDVVKQFINDVEDEPEEGTPTNPKKFYPSEIARFVKAMFELTSLCPYITPTGSTKSLTTDPRMVELRDELIEKYKDQLDDETVIAKIQDELVAVDKAWLEDDDAADFYLSGKDYSVKRKKMFIMSGVEKAFREDGGFTFVPKSLDEGWDMNHLPELFNSTREGSLDRGLNTAKGGEKVTLLQRMFQSDQVLSNDCGTKLTHQFTLTKDNWRPYQGMNVVEGSKLVRLNDETAKERFGTVVSLRRPILCQQPDDNDYCSACANEALARDPSAAAAEISELGSSIMLAYMSSMHGIELAVAEYKPELHIS